MSGPKHEEESDDANVNKENATPTSPNSNTKPPTPEVRVRVGGVLFVLDMDTLQQLNSEYLNRRVVFKDSDAAPSIQEYHQGSPRKLAQDDASLAAVVVEEGDAECFSSFLHMARFGTLPTSIFVPEKRDLLLNQADAIWGIRPQVEAALEKARNEFRQCCNCADAIYRCMMMSPHSTSPPVAAQARLPSAAPPVTAYASAKSNYAAVPAGESVVHLGGPHHNFRRDDGSRRVFCSACGHRDIDWRYHVGDYYSSCQKCQKEIRYKPDLGWCHKCRQCDTCQTSECPGVPIKQMEEQVVPFIIASLKNNESSLTFF
ncbi:expressed unknown protein [Seminavis robusta]|uniref:BTB domain-containing protein n=1 Tax=Seminavis robusta TaxID=568900 RepID=A0A9N8HUQ9_9STRA|nr:expressed unknown protein [Seminavis robusta]|eukprot:Sro1795_g298030.1 n/a (316) ;mRNA; f:11414-12361